MKHEKGILQQFFLRHFFFPEGARQWPVLLVVQQSVEEALWHAVLSFFVLSLMFLLIKLVKIIEKVILRSIILLFDVQLKLLILFEMLHDILRLLRIQRVRDLKLAPGHVIRMEGDLIAPEVPDRWAKLGWIIVIRLLEVDLVELVELLQAFLHVFKALHLPLSFGKRFPLI